MQYSTLRERNGDDICNSLLCAQQVRERNGDNNTPDIHCRIIH